MSHGARKPVFGVSDRGSGTNRPVCLQKQARLYYPCSENKGADQLRSFSHGAAHILLNYVVIVAQGA